ncbi:hypothetical protein L2Y96_19130 [Luteibacter aegosomaticola]|uniref:hypothetical protein n=1 Tax=Luteibacter aegosomaticola TaxID=2911538 RepID=UPI001FF9C763|nr:hypothetical protein [Luteibacter aegosomaticola]UPG89486.1 hypothetical protein L2Y96_19130 [Luteibacter aegosomaticola]
MNAAKNVLLLAGFALLSACAAPGEGAKAKSGYAAAAPVIKALEAYHQANAVYPASLDMLVPTFIAGDRLAATMPDKKATPFAYRQVANGYELSFSYTGTGTNQCVYRANTEGWKCYGAY